MKQIIFLLIIAAFAEPAFAQVNLGTNSGTSGGTTNTFIGESAGQNNSTGTHNTIQGYRALMTNTVGVGNVAIGHEALFSNTSGNTNIAIGRYALYSTTTVNSSIAIGLNALYFNTSGSGNVAMGVNSLSGNTTGNQNVAIGHSALNRNITNTGSVAIGYAAADSSTWSQVTSIGYNSDVKGHSGSSLGAFATSGTYAVAVGRDVNAIGTNSTALGALSQTTATGSIAVGYDARSLHAGSIALGAGVGTTATNQFIVGNATANQGIRDVYIGSGVTAANATSNGPLTIQPTGQGGTDQAGQTIRIAAGKGTGTGTPGDIVFLSGAAGASGSALQSITEKMIIKGNTGNVGIGVTTPSALLHTNGTVRMEGLTKDNSIDRVLVADSAGNIHYRDDSTFEGGSGSGNGWSMTGNAGIDTATAFIGTTDNQDVKVKRNSTTILQLKSDNFVTASTGIKGTNSAAPILRFNGGQFTANDGFIAVDFPTGLTGGAKRLLLGQLYGYAYPGQAYQFEKGMVISSYNFGISYGARIAFDMVGPGLMSSNRVAHFDTLGNFTLGKPGLTYLDYSNYGLDVYKKAVFRDSLIAKTNGLSDSSNAVATTAWVKRLGLSGGSSGGGVYNVWNLSGNEGINSALSFIGTTDNQPVVFKTNNTEIMRLGANGNIGIGTAGITDATYKLFVEGAIRSRQVTVDQDNWADYVFEDNYRLPTLTEVESYIKANKRLPDMPSAAEVTAKGVNIGDNQALLLRKIEELTLYSIDQNKQIEKQNKQIEKQQEQINQLLRLLKKD